MYKVIKRFHDLQDATKTNGGEVYHEYNVGDTFPRKGKEVSEERIAELAGSNNRQGVPLIELVRDAAKQETASGSPVTQPKKKAGKKSVKESEG